ncbi:MAG: ATP-binding protein [Kiritimatiellae bacterium]|nr:ATP-binding protein [Kiritimatiellia bacterium]
MTIKRDILLKKLIRSKSHNLIKILVGMRRCGKSFLLFRLFKQHLLESGIAPNHIVEIDLESDDFNFCRDAITLGKEIRARLPSDNSPCYVLIDEIQHAEPILPEGTDLSRFRPEDRKNAYITFYHVLNGLLKRENVSTYVTGSNARLLSQDVATEFRGRSEIINVQPLSLAEFTETMPNARDFFQIRDAYLAFGGLPECALMATESEKRQYLNNLNATIYLRDIAQRFKLKNDALLEAVADTAMSNIGCLANPTKLSNAINSLGKLVCNETTVRKYLGYLESAFLVQNARLFDLRGNRYLNYPSKYYAVDTGIRNSRLNFRQGENTHLMENVIFNELVRRDYAVDVGVVEMFATIDGKRCRRRYEVDFVVNKGDLRIYIQSAWNIPDCEKREQETFSLRHIGDNFRKIVVTGDPYEKPWTDRNGITFMGLKAFLLDLHSIETLV